MTRSHAPALLTIVAAAITREHLFARGDVVLLAVSGGPDSTALLHVLARLRAKLGHSLVAHGVDHGLRAEAASELDRAAAFAETLDVPFTRTTLALAPGGNLQARAREARYVVLRDAALASGASCIATAHHLEDRAETVLLRLLRGAGPRGLAVLQPRGESPAAGSPPLVRPMIRASRAAIDAHVERHHLPISIDPSNRDPHFLRVRVRHEVMPLLRELSPAIAEHLAALADVLGTLPLDAAAENLPRATRLALASLAEGRSPKARVLLPGGRVARFDQTRGEIVLAPSRPDGDPPAKANPTRQNKRKPRRPVTRT